MRAIRVLAPGGPDVLQLEDGPAPEPAVGEVRIQVEAAGVNFIDCYHRSGLYPRETPFVPGLEVSGRVSAMGPGTRRFTVGQRVVTAAAQGGYAEETLAPEDQVVELPSGIDSASAAAVMLQGLTAHYLATDTYPLRAGDTALVYAAAGGVGRLLVQIARRRGARVLAVVGDARKADLVRELGADAVLLRTAPDFVDQVRQLSDGRGVSVVYDGIGRSTFETSLRVLRSRGCLVSYGNASGPVGPVDPLLLSRHGSLYLTRPRLSDYTRTHGELVSRTRDLFDWLQAGQLRLEVSERFPLHAAAEAHRSLESGGTTGKLLLLVG